jgi:hypothetical protein
MEHINTTNEFIKYKRLSTNDDYYNQVFKKTERIAAAVFYILSYIPILETNRIHHTQLSTAATTVHTTALTSLNWFEHEVQDQLFLLQHALVALDSCLMVAISARVVANEVAASINAEVDTVLRYIRHHYVTGSTAAGITSGRQSVSPAKSLPKVRRNRILIPKNDMSSDAIMVYSQLSDRTTRIKTVLEAKPEATIKDLTDIITDVSAKTIQRDLNSLIENGEVKRQGERRWSKYSLA